MPSSYNPYSKYPDVGQWLGDYANQNKINQIMKSMGAEMPQSLMAQIIQLVLGKKQAQPMVEGTGLGGIKPGGPAPVQPISQDEIQKQQMMMLLRQYLGI